MCFFSTLMDGLPVYSCLIYLDSTDRRWFHISSDISVAWLLIKDSNLVRPNRAIPMCWLIITFVNAASWEHCGSKAGQIPPHTYRHRPQIGFYGASIETLMGCLSGEHSRKEIDNSTCGSALNVFLEMSKYYHPKISLEHWIVPVAHSFFLSPIASSWKNNLWNGHLWEWREVS